MSERPTLCFNGRFLDQKLTGVQRYSRELLERLNSRVEIVRPPGHLSPIQGHLWEQTVLPLRCGNRLLWSPGNTGPLLKGNQLVTIHDASTLDHPEWFSKQFAVWYRTLLPRLARRVRKIITVSQFSKDRLVEKCSIPAEKIVAIPNAIDRRFAPAPPEVQSEFCQQNQLEKPYLLYLGSLEPRKNVSILLEAWRQLDLKDLELVLAGISSHVFRERGFSSLPPGVRLFGGVADDDLPTLLSAARGFVFPSLYEGFGFPPLEAMACGCPVVTSNTTSLPEVCGPAFVPGDTESAGAVLYFDPTNSAELANCLLQMINMEASSRRRSVENGLRWTSRFTWERCAAQTTAVIDELIAP